MQRTCFALAMLLGWMASSVLVVGTTSQTQMGSVARLPGPGSVCGLVDGRSNPSVVLGQSVDAEDDGWSDEIGSTDQVASDSVRERDECKSLPASPVDDSNSDSLAANGWWEILGTGYDAAYDFAMHEGRYIDNGPSQRDIDHWLSTAGQAADDLDETYTVSGPSSSIACEDLDELFASEAGETETETYAGWLSGKLQLTQDWASNQLRPLWDATNDPAWMIDLRDRFLEYQAELQCEDQLNRDMLIGETLDGNESDRDETEPAYAPVATEDYQEEVLLISAAETLDRIGLRLQEAAQYLRYWAADRVVSKGNSRRVARSLDDQDANSHE